MFKFFNRKNNSTSGKFFFHTDIHSHVCPGIDDGATSPEKGATLVGRLSELGIEKMIATPHVTDEVFPNTIEIIDQSFSNLRDEMARQNVNMDITVSSEYRIDNLLRTFLSNGNVRPFPGNYILVECGWINEPINLTEFINGLVSKHGYKPILAHPERYPYYEKNPDRLIRLHQSGLRFQINLLSLAGFYGKQTKHMAEWLLEHKLVSFVGSDVHNNAHINCLENYLTSSEYRLLVKHESEILNDAIFYDLISS